MFEAIEIKHSIFLISVGAVFGSLARIKILDYSELIFKKRYVGLLVVNLSATFALAIISSFFLKADLEPHLNSFWLMISVGFLSSLSTFSSFILDLLYRFLDDHWKEFFSITCISLFSGLTLALVGFKLVYN